MKKSIKPKKSFELAGKKIDVFNDNPIPSRKNIKNTYNNIPDNTDIPLQFMTREQYRKKYINNQEQKKGIDFSQKQINNFMNNTNAKYRRINGRYTTNHNPYYKQAVVMFNDKKNIPNMTGNNFKKLAWHEYAHEFVDNNDVPMKKQNEEIFADTVSKQMTNTIEKDTCSKNKLLGGVFGKKQQEETYTPTPEYPEVTDEAFRKQQQERAAVEQMEQYGETRSYSGDAVGNTVIAADTVLPSGKVLTAAGIGAKRYVDKFKTIKTDEHDNPYTVPRIEVHGKSGIRPDTISEDDKYVPFNEAYGEQIENIYESDWLEDDRNAMAQEPYEAMAMAYERGKDEPQFYEEAQQYHLITDDDDNVIGFMRYRVVGNGKQVYVDDLFINPDVEGKGHGKKALQYLKETYNPEQIAGLSTVQSEGFWEKQGAQFSESQMREKHPFVINVNR